MKAFSAAFSLTFSQENRFVTFYLLSCAPSPFSQEVYLNEKPLWDQNLSAHNGGNNIFVRVASHVSISNPPHVIAPAVMLLLQNGNGNLKHLNFSNVCKQFLQTETLQIPAGIGKNNDIQYTVFLTFFYKSAWCGKRGFLHMLIS